MFGFGKKKEKVVSDNITDADVRAAEKELGADKMSAGMKETAQRMMSGQFDMNDMLAQLKQIKKMSNFSGLLKMVPGMSGAVNAMKEKIKDGSVDASDAAELLVLSAMRGATVNGGADPFTAEQKSAADLNGDTFCDANDAAYILQFAAEAGAGSELSIGEFMTRK